jgi:hypothetical protein
MIRAEASSRSSVLDLTTLRGSMLNPQKVSADSSYFQTSYSSGISWSNAQDINLGVHIPALW